MAIDISMYLELLSEPDRQIVKENDIHEQVEDLMKETLHSLDINSDIDKIENGTYGEEIRFPIYEALYKLSLQKTGPSNFDGTLFDIPSNFRLRTNTNKVTIPNGITKIGSYAFDGAESVRSIETPESVTELLSNAFNGCEELTSISLGNLIEMIFGDGAFYNCKSLVNFRFPTITYCPDTKNNRQWFDDTINKYDSNWSVTDLFQSMFYGCENLKSVIMPSRTAYPIGKEMFAYSGVEDVSDILTSKTTAIFEGGFRGSNVEFVKIPADVQHIKSYVFADCAHLESANCSDMFSGWRDTTTEPLTAIVGMFKNCINLRSVEWPDLYNITTWGTAVNYQWLPGEVFEGCVSLESINIPNGTRISGNNTFKDCHNLALTSSELEHIYLLGSYTFKNCTSLTELCINICTRYGGTVAAHGNYAFEGCTGATSLNFFDISNGSYSVTPDVLTTGMCKDCTGLVNIMWPCELLNIPSEFFSGCSNIESIAIDYAWGSGTLNLKKFDSYCFKDCSSLESIDIPSGVNNISYGVFSGCSSLYSINIPATLSNFATHSLCEGCENLTTFTIQTSSISYLANNIYDYDMFNGCVSLTSFTLLDNVTSYGARAFKDCESLTSIPLPNRITAIGEECFSGSGITSLTGNTKITSIPKNLCNGCSNLLTVDLPIVTRIYEGAFKDCELLESIDISAATQIDKNSFENCVSLTSVTFASIKTIAQESFKNCSGMTSITIPSKITTIGANVFSGCTNLTTITINKRQNTVSGAPWGAPNATVVWNG